MSKPLVSFFSATGNTKQAAQRLADAAHADLYEIRAAVPYTEADLNWTNNRSRSTVESRNAKVRPELADHDAPISSHDTIFVGFPIWWYTSPSIIRSFLEAYDFTGKRIILFATSGGSELGNTAAQLGTLVPGAKVESGRVLNGGASSPDTLRKWVQKLERTGAV